MDSESIGTPMGVVAPSSEKISIGSETEKTIEVQLSVHLDSDVLRKLPLLIAQKFNVLPVARIDDCLVLASDSQLTPQRVEELSQAIGEEVLFIPASIVNLGTLLKQVYGKSEKQQTEPRKLGQSLLDLGCSACGKVGYRGRVGLYELWKMTEEVRKLISKGVGEREIRDASHQGGCLRPLMEDALEKVHSGVTTLEELRRVVPLEQIRDRLRFGSVGET